MPILTREAFYNTLLDERTQHAFLVLQHKPTRADRETIKRYKVSIARIREVTHSVLAALEEKIRQAAPGAPEAEAPRLSDAARSAINISLKINSEEFNHQIGKIKELVLKINSLGRCEDADPDRAFVEPIDKLNLLKVTYNDLQELRLARILTLCELIEAEMSIASEALPAEIRLKRWHLILISLIAIGAAIGTAGLLAPVAIAAAGVTIGVIAASAAAGATGGIVYASGESLGLRLLGKRESASTIAIRIARGLSEGALFGAIGGAVGVAVAPGMAASVGTALGARMLTDSTAGAVGAGTRSICHEGVAIGNALKKGEKPDYSGAAIRVAASIAVGGVAGAAAGAIAHAVAPPTAPLAPQTPTKTPGFLQHASAPPLAPTTPAIHDGGATASVITMEDLTPEETELAKRIVKCREVITGIIAKGDPADPIATSKKHEALLAALDIGEDPTAPPRSASATLTRLLCVDSDEEEEEEDADHDAPPPAPDLTSTARTTNVFASASRPVMGATLAPT